MTPRRSDLALELAAERARRETLEAVNARLLDTLAALAPKGTAAPSSVVIEGNTIEPPEPALPPDVAAVCKRYDDQSARQYSINLRVAREMLAAGKTPEVVKRAIIQGEAVSA